VILHAIFDFIEGTDRAVLEYEGQALAVAEGKFREVPTPPRVKVSGYDHKKRGRIHFLT